MKKRILIDKDTRDEICRQFKVSNVTLWSALTYKTNSKLSDLLRGVALQRCGVLVDPAAPAANTTKAPKCATDFDTANHIMTQVFSPRVKIVVKSDENIVGLYVDGKAKVYDDITLADFVRVQDEAQKIADSLKQQLSEVL